MTKSYPENRMFGNTLPAAGFYVRHARNVRFNNVRFDAMKPDVRPLFFLDDVVGAELNQCKGAAPADAKFIRTVHSSGIVADGKYLDKYEYVYEMLEANILFALSLLLFG